MKSKPRRKVGSNTILLLSCSWVEPRIFYWSRNNSSSQWLLLYFERSTHPDTAKQESHQGGGEMESGPAGRKINCLQSRDVTGRHRSKKHAQTSLLCYILHEGQEFFIGLREQSWYFWSHRAHLLHVGIWLIWVALLPSERAGFDLAEHKTGLTSMPVRLWWLSSGFLLWFQLSQPNLWPAMSVLYQWHTSVGSSWPEYTLVSESTFPLCNLRWALLPAACACFASLLCIGQSYFKLVAFANHYVKRSVLISGPLWAAKMSVLLGTRRWHLVTFCQVTCLTAVLGCAFPATGLTTIMKPITVTGN